MHLHHARAASGVVLALALALGAAGCSSDEGASDETVVSATGVRSINLNGLEPPAGAVDGDADNTLGVRLGDREDPVPGLVQIDGGFDTLTEPARVAYSAATSRTTVTQARSGETRAFQRLCIGEVDLVDSARPLTEDEYEQCRLNGLDVVQFQVAADAVVLAIKAQTDVGADCLSTDQVRGAFQAGSEVENWSQLGSNLDDVELETGGPTVEFTAARFFARYVLEDPEPLNSDFRVDYEYTASEDATKQFVTGLPADETRAALLPGIQPQYVELNRQVKEAQGYFDQAQAEVVESVRQQRRGVRDKRSAAARAADDRRVTAAYAARGQMIRKLNSRKAALAPVARRYRVIAGAARRLEDAQGHVGLFSHGYYTTYENQLRPFEIEIYDGNDQPNCIFPSPQTILNGQYPLSRQLLVTVSTRALNRPEVKSFLSFYLGQSQRLAGEAGVVPLPNRNVEQQIAWINGEEKLPEFGIVDGRFRQLSEDDTPVTAAPPPAPEPENPAR